MGALLAAGANPNVRNRFGATPLHRAAYWNDEPEVVAALLAAGTASSAADGFGVTPRDFAAQRQVPSPEIVALLEQASADAPARRQEMIQKAARSP